MLRITYESLPDNYLFVTPIEWTILESQLPTKYHFKEDSLEYPSVEISGDRYIYLPLSIEDRTFFVIKGSRPVSRRLEDD